MTTRIFHLPVPSRQRPPEVYVSLDAATEWLLTELHGPASIAKMRALAKKELARPRDAVHRDWAKVFLKETEEYEK